MRVELTKDILRLKLLVERYNNPTQWDEIQPRNFQITKKDIQAIENVVDIVDKQEQGIIDLTKKLSHEFGTIKKLNEQIDILQDRVDLLEREL